MGLKTDFRGSLADEKSKVNSWIIKDVKLLRYREALLLMRKELCLADLVSLLRLELS